LGNEFGLKWLTVNRFGKCATLSKHSLTVTLGIIWQNFLHIIWHNSASAPRPVKHIRKRLSLDFLMEKISYEKLSQLQKLILVALSEPRHAVMKRRAFNRLVKRLY
jgi:hypothetical protein